MSIYSCSNTSSEDIEYIIIDYSDTSSDEFDSNEYLDKLFLGITDITKLEDINKSVLHNQLQSNLNKLIVKHEVKKIVNNKLTITI